MTGRKKRLLWIAGLTAFLGGALLLCLWAGFLPAPSDTELDAAVGALLLERIAPEEGGIVCQSHEIIGTRRAKGETRVYAWAMTQEVSCREGVLSIRRESHVPVILTLGRDAGDCRLSSYWEPEDGVAYEEAIRGAFPWHMVRRAIRLYDGGAQRRIDCLRQAEEHFGVAFSTPYLNLDWAGGEETAEPSDTQLVPIVDHIPDAAIDLKYASGDNFTGRVIYDFTSPLLRYGTVKKLAQVQEELKGQGYRLKIWDAYRPLEAHLHLWEANPDPAYVSDPATGSMSHSRGSAVDVTLVCADGTEAEMPSGFDVFSALADRDYSDVSAEAARNARLLEEVMERYGFQGYAGEWYHYADVRSYPVIGESPLA